MCPNNIPSRPATKSCLNQHLLRRPNGETKWHLPVDTHVFSVQLVLPQRLTCTQCVLQWKWNTTSNWGCDGSTCCKGCGSQEQFYGCSDVEISGSGSSYSAASGSRFPIVFAGTTGESSSIFGIGAPQSSSNQIGAFWAVSHKFISSRNRRTPDWVKSNWCRFESSIQQHKMPSYTIWTIILCVVSNSVQVR